MPTGLTAYIFIILLLAYVCVLVIQSCLTISVPPYGL